MMFQYPAYRSREKSVFVVPENFHQELTRQITGPDWDDSDRTPPAIGDWILSLPSPLHDGDRRAMLVQYAGDSWELLDPWVIVLPVKSPG